MHGPFNRANRRMFQTLRNPNIVTISESQIYAAPDINHAGTVYNGLPMEHYPFGDSPDDYLLFVGRISIEKGVHFAIEIAEQLDRRLIIAAKLEKVDRPYFKEYVEPYLTSRIQWIGEVDEKERNELMSKALCFLHPVTWREPFGLTIIESMACGCPVVAFNRGSIPEIVKHGITGYVVQGNDIEAMADAVDSIENIGRAQCREYALENFNEKRMTDNYENVYKKIMGNH
jgi:glycosyltransferase involved in cell wall biosynthesis